MQRWNKFYILLTSSYLLQSVAFTYAVINQKLLSSYSSFSPSFKVTLKTLCSRDTYHVRSSVLAAWFSLRFFVLEGGMRSVILSEQLWITLDPFLQGKSKRNKCGPVHEQSKFIDLTWPEPIEVPILKWAKASYT